MLFSLLPLLASAACAWFWSKPGLPIERIKLPPGFTLSIYAKVTGARSLALGPPGVLFVGTRSEGKVYAVIDQNRDHKADRVLVLASGLEQPNGVAFKDGSLYVAEVSRVLRYDGIESQLETPPSPVVVYDKYPDEGHHGWKFIAFGPDGWLYVPVGAPCNVCERSDERFASITRLKPDGSAAEVYARGIRNTVGFDWHPKTGELWFTDNGRDRLGDDEPPDELNRAPKPGLHFGFPYCHGVGVPDPEFGRGRDCQAFEPPSVPLGPHVAALGMEFYKGNLFPPEYRGRIFIAEHGSWNRSTPLGYRLMSVSLEGPRPTYEVFAEGWLEGRKRWGRPVDVEAMPDGALLVSDDHAGAVYRITYSAPKRP